MFIFFFSVLAYTRTHDVVVSGQLVGVGPFRALCRFQDLNSGRQAGQQGVLLAKPFCWPYACSPTPNLLYFPNHLSWHVNIVKGKLPCHFKDLRLFQMLPFLNHVFVLILLFSGLCVISVPLYLWVACHGAKNLVWSEDQVGPSSFVGYSNSHKTEGRMNI